MITEINTDDKPIESNAKSIKFQGEIDTKDYKREYSFTRFEDARFPGFDDKNVQDLLFKWYIY
jgi:hypothetical protein